MADLPSRRQFFLITLGSVATATLAACKSGGSGAAALSCNDVSALAPTDAQVRATLGYEDKSTDPVKNCTNCLQYVAAAPGTCGTCKVVKGPIHPDGNCKAWVAKPPA